MRMTDTVTAYMTEHPITIAPVRPVVEAYAIMAEHGVRHLPVVENGRLVGMISDRDLHRGAPLRDARKPGAVDRLFATPVAEIMTLPPLVTIDPLTTLGEAARLLIETGVHSLPVLDEEQRLVGIVTTHDLLRALTGRPRAA